MLARVAGGWELTDLGREALSAAAETMRRPEVGAVVDAIRARMHDQRQVLLGAH